MDIDEDDAIVKSGVRTRATTRKRNRSQKIVADDEDEQIETGKPSALKGAGGGYAWEDEYRRSWDIVQEDASGSLEGIVSDLVDARKRRRAGATVPVQRGIIRTVVLILDYSGVMREKDVRPTRGVAMIEHAVEFVGEFFDQNPVSQVAIVAMRNGIAHIVSELGGSPHEHITALRQLRTRFDPEGEPSLQNALNMARGVLAGGNETATREVVIIFGALFSADPGNIHKTISALVKERITVRVIGLTARVAVCEELCSKTSFGDVKSTYHVALDENHFKELVMECVTPLAVTKRAAESASGFSLVKMGFPSRASAEVGLCACHSQATAGGYVCPQCGSKVCTLPTVCPCCSLTLVLSTHLARSYHHLFPLQTFDDFPEGGICLGCGEESGAGAARCPQCKEIFCVDCDVFLHETLHTCAGCESKTKDTITKKS